MKTALEALHRGDLVRLAKILAREPELARKPQLALAAAQTGNVAALECLQRSGADWNASWRNYRPLHALIQEAPHSVGEATDERLTALDWLLAHGADPEQLGAWPPARAILVAAFGGSAAFVERLRAGGARVDAFVACALGKRQPVARALRADPGFASARDAGGLTALQCCAGSRLWRGDGARARALLGIAQLLLDAGAEPNAPTRSWGQDVDAVYFAVSSGNEALFTLLLERGAGADAALASAIWREDERFAELALAHGARPDRSQAGDRPLLNEMIRWGQVRQALWLLERGADPNVADPRGWTALHQAASRGNERMFAAVLAAGGDPKRRDRSGRTALDVATEKRLAKLVRLALSAAKEVLQPAKEPERARKRAAPRRKA